VSALDTSLTLMVLDLAMANLTRNGAGRFAGALSKGT
jgi:hypothetical protein